MPVRGGLGRAGGTAPVSRRRYPVPDIPAGGMHRTLTVVRRSRFIASAGHAPDAAAARHFVETVRKEFPDATHNCWAFAAGPPGHTAQVGFSDDGEPHGSAGRPMLSMLLHGDVGEIVCVTTRYFGGVKLGVGGLVRAYQEAVRDNLRSLPVRERIVPARLHVIVDYPHVDALRRLLPAFEARTLSETFAADAAFVLLLPQERAAPFILALAEHTDGSALIETHEEQ